MAQLWDTSPNRYTLYTIVINTINYTVINTVTYRDQILRPDDMHCHININMITLFY